jgi:signal peptidase II
MKHVTAIIALAMILLLDQLSKYLILTGSAGISYITGFLNITNVWNEGIAFGLFSNCNGNIIFMFLTGAIILFFGYLLLKTNIEIMALTYGFIIGGAVGNLIDRIRYGAVFDFIDLHVASFHWPAFNVADSFICVGGTMLAWNLIINKKSLC